MIRSRPAIRPRTRALRQRKAYGNVVRWFHTPPASDGVPAMRGTPLLLLGTRDQGLGTLSTAGGDSGSEDDQRYGGEWPDWGAVGAGWAGAGVWQVGDAAGRAGRSGVRIGLRCWWDEIPVAGDFIASNRFSGMRRQCRITRNALKIGDCRNRRTSVSACAISR